MIATHNHEATKEGQPALNLTTELVTETKYDRALGKIKNLSSSPLLLPSRIVMHSAKSGLNPSVDASAYLFSVLGKLKSIKTYRQLSKLQKELIHEINAFQDNISDQGYNAEYIVVCRYVICATFDDVISNTSWGAQGQWDNFSLLAAFNQDLQHHDKFFTIMERAIKEPKLYIDLMELMYICLSMGYKGQHRVTEHSQYQLEQITNNLYKHIRAYRGDFSKTLSPASLKIPKTAQKSASKTKTSLFFIFFVTACIIMTIFISLGYLMDVISNEAYKPLAQIQSTISRENPAT